MLIEPPRRVCGAAAPAAYDADIIILALERSAETLKAVASARAQLGATCFVWVLDQGSSPATRAGFAAAFNGLSGLAYYESAANLGVGGGRNFLSGLGHGRIIVALDNDAVFASADVVARTLDGFAATPPLAATGFKILARDGVALDRFSWGHPARQMARADQRFDAVTFVGAGHAIRRAAWQDVGGYDPALFFTWEEYDFCLRAIARGWRINHDGCLAVIHKVAPQARVSWSNERTYYFVRNRLLIARRWNAPWPALLPRILGYLIRGAREHRLAATLRGIRAAILDDRRQPRQHMSAEMRAYLKNHDTIHRGSPLTRLRGEVLRELVPEHLKP
jgi:GT2 family glycosyltransferase